MSARGRASALSEIAVPEALLPVVTKALDAT